VGCPDRWIDRLCITCCSPSQPSHHAMVLGAISSDPQRGWIIVYIASDVNMSERTLRRKLREENTSFRNLVDQLRMEMAIKYLRDTDLTVEAISESVGFSDAANSDRRSAAGPRRRRMRSGTFPARP
jgi:AraC-like DNA-binding protein